MRAAVEVLKACDLYGKVAPPKGAVEPEQVMVEQAEAWAKQEVQARIVADGREFPHYNEAQGLARDRLQELRAAG